MIRHRAHYDVTVINLLTTSRVVGALHLLSFQARTTTLSGHQARTHLVASDEVLALPRSRGDPGATRGRTGGPRRPGTPVMRVYKIRGSFSTSRNTSKDLATSRNRAIGSLH